ncbi:fungal-specific transcription factor domain-domain-containing protein [Kockovaella imperatae]|uniref:Fungal-specific transcription factor domain-domain-containing protein n=1 Tax=Kockovaella imperatae TaxID=4999 RepID=A0A1Y1UPC0_9TREE|nr:fungal-specific transcription factor domain-domain-containing protein [Kockovaella imperatae]ORX39881.1 fungal-specific transcription factor domain-domain-containing protein [Kockovaella imperatae]
MDSLRGSMSSDKGSLQRGSFDSIRAPSFPSSPHQLFHGSPPPFNPIADSLPRRDSNDNRKRSRLSFDGTSSDDSRPPKSSSGPPNSSTWNDGRRQSNSRANGSSGLTSCEACRKGKRRCEPSPLVPPDHPDIANLPCARCRRFALECIRVKVTRRKGPAPVDLSAISDAVHGFPNGEPTPVPNPRPPAASAPDIAPTVPNLPVVPTVPDAAEAAFPPSSIDFTSPSYPILAVSPSLSTSTLPENLDQVAAPHVIDHIIGLFFNYVYPLTPCLHRPTFLHNLALRLDKTDTIFFALTLTIIASTLVQIPRSLVNLDKSEVESLARRCVKVARVKISYIFDDPGPVLSTYVVICYLEGIVHLLLGNNTAHVICTAQANQLALALRLNEESSYESLDPIECEMRRRIYWLLFQADKSTACLRARTICLRLEDAANLMLPSEVDDEQITPAGILPQPFGKTPLITGFNIATNLFRILNDALLLQRRKAPPTVDSILADLSNVNELREKVIQTALDVAPPLKLRSKNISFETSPDHDWETELHERVLDFFQDPGETPHALNSFTVMQGNILVTQHLVRLVLLQTRESLFQQLALLTQMPMTGVGGLAGLQMAEAAEDIARELLDGLNSLPVESVAINGPSLVQKVRFVAIQLMECSVSPSPTTARAQKLLMQFLSVLGVIEGMYTFGRDISAE